MILLRLKVSNIPEAGIGVFTLVDIPQGTDLKDLLFEGEDWLYKGTNNVGELEQTMVDHFGMPVEEVGWYIPQNWHRMSIGWYLNNAFEDCNLDADLVAKRDIAAGEELTIHYGYFGLLFS